MQRAGGAPHHDHFLVAAIVDRLIVFGKAVGAHQIDPRQELVGGVNPVQMLARYAQELRKPRSGGQKNGVVAFLFHQFIDGYGLSDSHVGLEFHAHLAEIGSNRSKPTARPSALQRFRGPFCLRFCYYVSFQGETYLA
jgi:hypothetical protein